LADVAARKVKATFHLEIGFGFNFLGEKLSENYLLSEILCTDNEMVGSRRRARREEC
jgi:hypothetical protein